MFERKTISGDEVLLVVDCALTGETVPEFHRQMVEIVEMSSAMVTLDLSRCEAMNSHALGKILNFKNRLAEQQRTLQIRGCSANLFRQFQMVKFDTLISIKR